MIAAMSVFKGLFDSTLFGAACTGSLALAVLIFGWGKSAESAEPVYYTLAYKADGVNIIIEINGVPVSQGDFEFSGSGQTPVNVWLKPGKNIMTVKLKNLTGKKQDVQTFKVFLSKAKEGQYPDAGEMLTKFEWNSDTSKEKLPLQKKLEFTPQPVPELEIWTKAEVLTLNPETEKGAKEFLQVLHQAHVKKDINKIAELMEFKSGEYDRAEFKKPEGMSSIKKGLKEFMNHLKSSKAEYKPIDLTTIKLNLVADGRVILVTDKDGKDPIVATASDGGDFFMPVYLAHIGGKWVLAR